MRIGSTKGSTMLEFALLAPVLAALLAGTVSVSMTFVRTLQADDLCRRAAQMAASGADFEQDQTRNQFFALYGGKTLEEKNGVLYLSHIVREAARYRLDKTYSTGNTRRWKANSEAPEQLIQLEPGEDAWVAEIWIDNTSILFGITPKEVHARNVL